jgi:hypothetical protein
MTDIAGHRIDSERSKRRVPFVDTVAVRGFVWLALALVLIAPIALTRLLTPAAVHHTSSPAAPTNRTASPAPPPVLPLTPAPALTPPVAAPAPPSNPIPHTPTASVRDRLAAILSAYQSRDDFGTPETATQAAGALQWCARQLAGYEHISVSDASRALSTALIAPRSAAGLRVVSAIEAPAQGADETSRMQCASLLYTQLNAE